MGKPNLIVSQFASQQIYQKIYTKNNDSQLDMLSKIELSTNEHNEIITYCKNKKIQYLCTPFDLPSIDFLKHIKLNLWKIPSGEITNYPYLKKIASFRQPVILSTGMSTMEDIEQAMNDLLQNDFKKIDNPSALQNRISDSHGGCHFTAMQASPAALAQKSATRIIPKD
jgi:N,N'-diacetyllegionaminate synthase